MQGEGAARLKDRVQAGTELGKKLKGKTLFRPLVLAIPPGGIVVGEAVAKHIRAELDFVLVRKLRAPWHPQIQVGAISENNDVYFDPDVDWFAGLSTSTYVQEEQRRQFQQIERRMELLRQIRPAASVKGRSVVLVDDGMASGSTVVAAIQFIRTKEPFEVIVAVPVASSRSVNTVEKFCDKVLSLHRPEVIRGFGEYFDDFSQIEEAEVVRILSRLYGPEACHSKELHGAGKQSNLEKTSLLS